VASSIDGISPLILGTCWTRQTQIIGPQLEMESEAQKKKIQIQHSKDSHFLHATRIGCGGGKFATLLSRLLDSIILKFKSNNK
jgi:hypothetical protein